LRGFFVDVSPATVHELESEEAKRLFNAANNQDPPDAEQADIIIDRRIRRIKRDALLREAEQIQEQIASAQRENDKDRAFELTVKKAGIDKQIQEVGAA